MHGHPPHDEEVAVELASMVVATHEHWAGHAGPWWPIFPILWISLIFGFIYFLKRGCARRYHRSAGESVLGERYARGEIDEREYRERLDVLRAARPGGSRD